MLLRGTSDQYAGVRVRYMSLVSRVTTGLNVIKVLWIRKQVAEIHN
jgi:hypothetical protein